MNSKLGKKKPRAELDMLLVYHSYLKSADWFHIFQILLKYNPSKRDNQDTLDKFSFTTKIWKIAALNIVANYNI